MAEVIPPALKSIEPYIKQALQADKGSAFNADFAKIAYYCRTAAAEEGMGLLSAIPASQKAAATAYLTGLLGRLEEDRAAYSITKDQEPTDMLIVQRYALTFFKKADEADRYQCATLETVSQYKNAAEVMSVMRKLNYADAPTNSRIKYAKSRAAEIFKALKNRVQPGPPPGTDDSEMMAGLDALLEMSSALPPVPSAGGSGGGGAAAAATPASVAAPLAAARAEPGPYASYSGGGGGTAPDAGAPYAAPYAAYGGSGGKEEHDDDIPMAVPVHPPPSGTLLTAAPYYTPPAVAAAAGRPSANPDNGAPVGGSTAGALRPGSTGAPASAAPGGAAAGASTRAVGGAPPPGPAAAATAPQRAPHAGSSASSSNRPTAAVLHDAKEYAKFALAALNASDVDADLVAQHLRSALKVLGR